MNWLSWQLFLKVLPLTIGFCGLKYTMHWLGFEPWTFDSLTSALFGASTFILALVLSGTLADYRTSETMPLQIINSIDTIQDTNLLLAMIYPQHQAQGLQVVLLEITRSILAWLQEDADFELVEQSLQQLNQPLALLQPIEGGWTMTNQIQAEQAKVRLLVQQIRYNRETDFVPAAYALLLLFLVAAVIALLLIHSDSFSENLIISAFLFTSLAYLFLFVRDLDNPFEYSGKSCVDVDLKGLQGLHDRLNVQKS
jgi:hypothetical protein